MRKIKINIPHFYCLEYVEGEKKMVIEIDFREMKLLFGKSLIKQWEAPYSTVKISEKEQEEIYYNILQFLLKEYSISDIIDIG